MIFQNEKSNNFTVILWILIRFRPKFSKVDGERARPSKSVLDRP